MDGPHIQDYPSPSERGGHQQEDPSDSRTHSPRSCQQREDKSHLHYVEEVQVLQEVSQQRKWNQVNTWTLPLADDHYTTRIRTTNENYWTLTAQRTLS